MRKVVAAGETDNYRVVYCDDGSVFHWHGEQTLYGVQTLSHWSESDPVPGTEAWFKQNKPAAPVVIPTQGAQ